MGEGPGSAAGGGGVWPAALATAALFSSMAIVPPTADALVRGQFGLGNTAVSLFFMIHSMPQLLLLGIVVGMWSDWLGRRLPIAVVAGVGTGITTMLHPWMTSYGGLLALRFLDGVFGIAALCMLMTRALDLAQGPGRGRVMGIYMGSIPVGYLAGSFFVAVLGGERLREVFFAAGAFVVVSSLWLAVGARGAEQLASSTPSPRHIWRLLSRARTLWFPFAFGFVDKFTFGLITMLTGLALSDRYQLSPIVWGGSALGLMWVAYLVASVPAGGLAVRLGSWRAVALGSACYGATLVAMVASSEAWVFVAALTLAGVFIAIQMVPTYMLLAELSTAEDRATVMGAFNLLGSLGLLAGLGFGGFASVRWGYLAAFGVGGVLEIASAIVAILVGRRLYGQPQTSLPPAGTPIQS